MSKSQIILLFSNLDDKTESGYVSGWVSTFVDKLNHLLIKLDGDHYDFIKVTEYEIDPEAYPVAPSIIIPVVSKNFLQAPIFTSYLEVFEKEVLDKQKKKDRAEFKLINVFKNRVNTDNLPGYLIHHSTICFYTVDSITDFVSEISYENDPEKDHNYWMKLFDIATEIKHFHYRNEGHLEYAKKLVDEMRPSGLYLAQSGIDLELERENLERELRRNNFPVLQINNLENTFDELSKEINNKLGKSYISIHLIGEDAGKLIKERGLSIVEIENQLASEHARQINDHPRIKHANRFKRIIWLAPKRDNLSVKQKLFIENIKKDIINIQNAEVLEIPIEELKNFINNLVEERNQSNETSSLFDTGKRKKIYFICSKNEYDQCEPIGELLEEEGYEIVYSNFEGELIKIRDQHNRHLKECDGTLIYYGNNSENWVKSKLFDSVKAMGMGREKDKNPTAVIVDSNKKVDLDLYLDSDKLILYKGKQITKEAFKSFLSQLNKN